MDEQPIDEELSHLIVDPNAIRWSPIELTALANGTDFVRGLKLIASCGATGEKKGISIYNYACNISMTDRSFSSADGDLLIVPQQGSLLFQTELGHLSVAAGEIVVVPRGVRFSVGLSDSPCRGYIVESFEGHFELPLLGPIGSNGLANPRDFRYPVARFEDVTTSHVAISKFQNKLFTSTLSHSPFDVVAWHGNYAPYKYDLKLFNCINSVSFDHPDPSIYTVLTCPTSEPGVAAVDLVVFPPRWVVAQHTFRPPYFHRNCMTEYMGLIRGKYDGKSNAPPGDAFLPGGASLHSCMTPHGPDSATFIAASSSRDPQQPMFYDEGLAFMFETTYMLKVTPSALSGSDPSYPSVQADYQKCWAAMPKLFTGQRSPDLPWH